MKSSENEKKSPDKAGPKLGTALAASGILFIIATVVIVSVVAKRRKATGSNVNPDQATDQTS